MHDNTLLMVLDEVRSSTLNVLEGVDGAAARWRPPGLANSMLWHAGHAYIVTEWFTAQALGTAPECPPGWYELFSWDSRPGEAADDAWPPLEEVVGQLRLQHGRLRKLISRATDEQLSSPALAGAADQTARYRIFHGLHDEARHNGEIWLLRKMWNARTAT